MPSPLRRLRPLLATLLLALGCAGLSPIAPPAPEALAEGLVPTVEVQARQGGVGWRAPDASGATSGGDGLAIGLQALRLTLDAPDLDPADLSLSVYQRGSWGPYAPSGQVAGDGESAIQGVRVRLAGEAAALYSVAYRSVPLGGDWLGWAEDDAVSGGPGVVALEAVQVRLLPKGAPLPADGGELPAMVTAPGLETYGYVSGKGWDGPQPSGGGVGEGGRALHSYRALIAGDESRLPGSIRYRVFAGSDWRPWVLNGDEACPVVPDAPIQALQLTLEGTLASSYDLWYRVYVHDMGWLGYAKGGESAGSVGFGLPAEAIQVHLLPKGQEPAELGGSPTVSDDGVEFFGYAGAQGWQGPQGSGGGVGVGGQALHGFKASLTGGPSRLPGSIRYRVYTGSAWREWAGDGQDACPIEADAPIQAIQIVLTGYADLRYDLWYRALVPGLGWLDYAPAGATAGSTGILRAAEAIELHLVPSGAPAPGPTGRPFVDESAFAKLGWQNPEGYYQVSSRSVLPRPGAYWPFNYVTPSRISVWASREECVAAFVQRAYEYIGTPYVWNYSCAPGVGVDCIGLVYQCAYATGMDLGEFNPWDHWATGSNGWHSHDAVNMWNYGQILRLPIAQRQYGDLIFYPGHVGIYVGNDRMIHAYTPATGVFESSIWGYGTILGVGRLYL